MAKVSRTFRFDEVLVARVGAFAAARGLTATDVFASGAELLLGEDAVPLPVPARPRVVRASVLSRPSVLVSTRQERLNEAKGC